MMNFERIQPSIDVDRLQASHVTMIGGAYGLIADLVRCGLGSATLIDFDHIDSSNPARQDLLSSDIGQRKTDATARHLRCINPDVEIEALMVDYCSLRPEQIDEILAHTDLVIDGTDFFPVHARVNQDVLRLRKPALWIGLYRGGRAGEVVYWVPGVTEACYRCICSARYAAFERGTANVSSSGGTIMDLRVVDGVAGHIAAGILTGGADNRAGRLVEQLGQRNILQVKLDPDYTLGGRDLFAEHLGHGDANFSFTTIALRMERDAACPDCAHQHALKSEPNHHATHSATHVHS